MFNNQKVKELETSAKYYKDRCEKLENQISELKDGRDKFEANLTERYQKIEAKRAFEYEQKEARKDLELEQERLELKYSPNSELQKLIEKNHELEVKLGKANASIDLLEKAVDVSGEVLDVKNLVGELIAKIPSVDINNLTLHSTAEVTHKKA